MLKWAYLIAMGQMCFKTGDKMPGVSTLAMISVRNTILSLSKKNWAGPANHRLVATFLLFIIGKNLLDQNDVEFDFSIGHALVIFAIYKYGFISVQTL